MSASSSGGRRSSPPHCPAWLGRERLCALMVRSAETPMEFLKLQTGKVIELGSQVEI
jgi:K+ transporter